MLTDRGYVSPGRPEDIVGMGERLRVADKRELYALGEEDLQAALDRSWEFSSHRWTIFVDDVPAGFFGVAPTSAVRFCGVVWLVGTPRLKYVAGPFARLSRAYIDAMLHFYPKIENYVHAENVLSLRWVRWCGFDVAEPAPHGPFGKPFCLIVKTREVR